MSKQVAPTVYVPKENRLTARYKPEHHVELVLHYKYPDNAAAAAADPANRMCAPCGA